MIRSVFGALLVWAASAASAPAAVPSWAVAVLPSGHEFTLEIAADEASRERGYMAREQVGAREGMLFIFPEDGRHAFWMKDCKVSLDMIWLDARFHVVWIAARQAPCPADGPCPSVAPPDPARYVLAFAAGTANVERLRAGDSVVILSDPTIR